jgi:hypothetical protein
MRSRHPVEPASYEADLTRVLKWAVFCHGLVVLVLLSLNVGTPILLVPTVAPEPLGDCVITLLEAFLLMNWNCGIVDFSGGGRASAPSGCSLRGHGGVFEKTPPRSFLCFIKE